MSTVEEGIPNEPHEVLTLEEHLSKLEQARAGLLAAAHKFVHSPIEENTDLLVEQAAQSATAVYGFTEFVLADELTGPEQKGEIIARMIKVDSDDRLSCFNNLFRKKKSFAQDPLDEQSLVANIKQTLESDNDKEAVLEGVINGYRHNLGVDLGKLIEYGESSINAKVISMGKHIGWHSIDILKTGAGVAVGALLLREWERRRSS